MPKFKTRKSAAKRFSCSATGKIRRGQAGSRHFLSIKSSVRKRKLSKKVTVSSADHLRIKKLIPYK